MSGGGRFGRELHLEWRQVEEHDGIEGKQKSDRGGRRSAAQQSQRRHSRADTPTSATINGEAMTNPGQTTRQTLTSRTSSRKARRRAASMPHATCWARRAHAHASVHMRMRECGRKVGGWVEVSRQSISRPGSRGRVRWGSEGHVMHHQRQQR